MSKKKTVKAIESYKGNCCVDLYLINLALSEDGVWYYRLKKPFGWTAWERASKPTEYLKDNPLFDIKWAGNSLFKAENVKWKLPKNDIVVTK